MHPVNFQRVKELFQQAMGLPHEERERFLAGGCAGDEELAAEVRDLLRHAQDARDFLDRDGKGAAPAVLRIPGYTIVEQLAAGASGAVYRAHQDQPRREVALKVLRVDSLVPGQVARFRREAHILASLDHPGIARVFACGVIEDGPLALPWIAMEFVQGTTLDGFVESALLGAEDRIRLIADVCDALEHAHQHGIVHRDLKPTNVMVDHDGRPRVIDFGIAHVGAEAGLTDVRTRTGMLLGTLGFMAPEQAGGERDPTTASDVYSLAAMLFECLTGRLPVELDGLELIDAVQAVCVEEALPLRQLRPDLPRDLETILAKALEKDPRRRYRSAGELRDDLLNLLDHRPVRARRATLAYKAWKFTRRHRALTMGATVVALALSTGLVLSLHGLRVEREAHANASATLDQLAARILDLVPALGFGEAQRPALEDIERLAAAQLAVDPRNHGLRTVRAKALLELAGLTLAAGDPRRSLERADEARGVLEAYLAEAPDDLDSWTRLSQAYARLGEACDVLGDATGHVAWVRRAFDLDERLVHENPGNRELIEDLGWSLNRMRELAVRRGDHAEAFRIEQRWLSEARPLVEAEPDNGKYAYNLSQAEFFVSGGYEFQGDLVQATAHMEEAVRLATWLVGAQPDRRDFLRWHAQTCEVAAYLARKTGNLQGTDRHLQLAFRTALQLVYGDPHRSEFLELVGRDAEHAAQIAHELDRPEDVCRVGEQLRAVVEHARRAGSAAPALEGLLGSLKNVDQLALAVAPGPPEGEHR